MRLFGLRKEASIALVLIWFMGFLGIFSVHANPLQQTQQDYVWSEIALSGNGQIIAILGRQIVDPNNPDALAYAVDFYNTATAKLIKSINTIPYAGGISLNQDGSLLAYGTGWGDINVMDTSTGIKTASLMGGGAESGYTRWNSVSDRVASFMGGATFVFKGSTGKQERILVDPEVQGLVNGIGWNFDGTKLATTTYWSESAGSGIAKIQIWDTTLKQNLYQPPLLRIDGGGSVSLAWSPDDTKLATNVRGGIAVYDAKTGQPLQGFSTEGTAPTYQVAWSPDGTKIAAGGPQAVWIWDVSTREMIDTFPVTNIANSIAWSPDSEHVYHNGGAAGIYRDGMRLSQAVLTATPTASPTH